MFTVVKTICVQVGTYMYTMQTQIKLSYRPAARYACKQMYLYTVIKHHLFLYLKEDM